MTTIPLYLQTIKHSDIQKAFGGNNSNSFKNADSLNTLNNYTISGLNLNNGNISNINTITATNINGNGNNITNLNYNNIINKPNLNIYAQLTSVTQILGSSGSDIGDHIRYTFNLSSIKPPANNSIICRIIYFNIINSTGIVDGSWYNEGIYQYKSDSSGYSTMYTLQIIKQGSNGVAIDFYAGYLANVYNYWLATTDRMGYLMITNIINI